MMDQAFLFNNGLDYMSYNLLGAFPATDSMGQSGFRFAVWAPLARHVSVVGQFNHWNALTNPLQPMGTSGIWTGFIAGTQLWDRYKYAVTGVTGHTELKADPYARHSETRPGTASVLYDPDDYTWQDETWMSTRPDAVSEYPLNIYEVHLGSWKRNENGDFMNYRELAIDLGAYCKSMGYTAIELMPIMEHPLDDSWGYQVTGYFSVTSRFGTPADFKFFVDHLHGLGLRVLLDWVPAHFPRDAFGLAKFNGQAQYEYADSRLGEHREWGTLVFDFSKKEVNSFLISNAFFWLREFHIDGLRVDAVSSMLYLDYGRTEYLPNIFGGRDNIDAINFMHRLNSLIREEMPGVLMIAEESTAWAKVSHPVVEGGLGFTHKWNMGWMHDTLDYMSRDYVYRKWHQSQLSFSLMYAFSERFILPLSHDEVVHGKRSLIDRMPGDTWRKFACLRALYLYYMAHPGSKLMFMGGEFGQFIEWRFYEQLEWFLLEHENHRQLNHYVSRLNHIYRDFPALWQCDHSWQGFNWISADDAAHSVYIFYRQEQVAAPVTVLENEGEVLAAEDPAVEEAVSVVQRPAPQTIMVVLNLTPTPLNSYEFGVPLAGHYQILMNTDESVHGGSGYHTGCDADGSFVTQPVTHHGLYLIYTGPLEPLTQTDETD
jgi:1,4-alpha-glucan branching enzyme